MKPKIIANYLPQFHQIPENDMWWGKNYTDWVAVKKAKPLFADHAEPRIPLNDYYYDLSQKESIVWQTELAVKYGIYGFGIYHYWFSEKMNLLHKPAEIILNNKDIHIHYMFIWDNEPWKRTWSNIRHANDWAPNFDDSSQNENNLTNTGNGILADLIYGTEDAWKEHFNYLLPFFKDERYIKIDNKPIFGFYQPRNDYNTIKKMAAYWDLLAKDCGFSGMICMSRDNHMNYDLEYKFRYTPLVPNNLLSYLKYKSKDIYTSKKQIIRFYDYDKCWAEIIKEAKRADSNTFLSGFVQFDDTPRRGKNGRVVTGASPEKFNRYLRQLLDISERQDKEYVFLTAWNEWGEGAYLEPDTINRYAYLSAVKKAVDSIGAHG